MTAPALSEFERLVQQCMAMGFSREKSEAEVRRQFPNAAGSRQLQLERSADVLEKQEQHEIYKLFRAYGFIVRNLSQARASKQAPGLGDAWVTHKTQPIAFWWESKRQIGGKLSLAQVEMRDDCERCRIGYHHGDRHDAARLLIKLGLARVDASGPCGIVPFHEPR